MNKLKVMTIIGTRPEIIRLSRIIPKLDEQCNHILVHTGQNYDYELNEIFFSDLELRKPDYFLNAAGKNAVGTVGQILIAIDPIMDLEKPDAILILGDTNSGWAAFAAKRKKIPIFHMEAGNRSFDQRIPEEINRKLIDHLSDVNLPYSSIAREYLLKEGLPPNLIIKTGSPMKEVLNYYKSKIEKSSVLDELKLVKKEFFLVSFHREENLESLNGIQKLSTLLNSLAKKYNFPIIFSLHPRTKLKFQSENIQFDQRIKLINPIGFFDYNKLQINAKVVISDSGTISEESSIQNFPAINIRESHERPECMEAATVMMTGLNKDRVFQAIEILGNKGNKLFDDVSDYQSICVSEKILRIIHSYTDYVNFNVWKKNIF